MCKWDKEYATSFPEEVEYLKNNKIRWTFVKTNEHGISVFKYAKTRELFSALLEFYK